MSLSLFARRAAVNACRRVAVSQPMRAALSTNARKVNETLAYKMDSNDTHMHDQFEILEKMLDEGLVDRKKVSELKAMWPKVTAVDAPDGASDAELAAEMKEIQAIFDDVAAHKDEINARLAKLHAIMKENQKIFAVESPDGEVDGHIAEEMEEIKHIIDDAAKLEDKDQIDYQHKMEGAVRKERARDPEHDW